MMTFQIKIQILDLGSPDVWRRLMVPANFSFHHFHNIIQAAFGWTNAHLYEFSPEGIGSNPVITHPDFMPETEYRNSVRFKLSQHFAQKGDKIIYTYDFGDGWAHLITLESITDEPTQRVTCIDGGGACPPEDCGGPGGYQNFKLAINDPAHEEFASLKEWAGIGKRGKWDASKFNKERTNRILEKM
jgi:Plasmid pRiA4b ORF-3-like protein